MIGKILKGIYKILDEVGSGGIAAVYLARNLQTGETVAVKVIHSHIAAAEKSFLSRFQREAEILRSLSSPHIPRYYDSGLEDGLNYIVIEYIQGISVADLIKQRKQLDVETALDIVRQTAKGLQCTYERGIVHRDIKPANLMVTVENVVKVMDFGIARNIDALGLTQTGFLGTPNYISPEQADGKETDIRSDIYSLGASLFEMLSGRILYDGNSPISVAIKHISAPVPSITLYRKDVPPAVEDLLNRCLAKNPGDRFQTPAELISAIDAIIGPAPAGTGRTPVRSPLFSTGEFAVPPTAVEPATDFAMTSATVEDGSRSTRTITCPLCQATVPASAVFCPKCGGSIPKASAPVPAEGESTAMAAREIVPTSKEPVPKGQVGAKKGNTLVYVSVGVVVLLVALAGGGALAFRAIGSSAPATPVATLPALSGGITTPAAASTSSVARPTTPIGPGAKELVAEGSGLLLQSRYDDAIELYRKAIEIDSLYALAYIEWGRALIWSGNPSDAISKLEKAAKTATTDADKALAYGQLARAYDWTYRFKDAVNAAQTALQLDANNADAHAFLAEAELDCINAGDCPSNVDVDMAEVEVRAALRLDEKSVEGQTVLAAVERQKGHLDAAITAARKAVDLQPNVALRHYNLGTLYLENANYDLAVGSFRRSIELYGKFAHAYYALGQTYKVQNRCSEAIPQFEEVLKIDPKYTSALHALEECRRQVK